MNFETMSKQRKMVLIAAAVGVISMFLPWVSVSGYSVNGMHGWGVLVFICLLAAGFLAFTGNQTANLDRTAWMAVLIAGGIASLIMVINFLRSLDGLGYVSIGFYGALAASIGVLAFAFMHRSATDTLQGGFDSLKGEINRKINTPSGNTTTGGSSATNDPNRPIV